VTGLLCWRDFHPQEWQLAAIMHDAESFRTSIRRRRALAIRPAGSV
jgi:hypothetical protein